MTDATPYRRIIRGYTGQARFWANDVQSVGDDAVLLGWTRLSASVTKPVYQLRNGRPIVMLAGPTHLDMTVVAVSTPIVPEHELY